MLLIDSLAEEQIQAAIRRGEFDDLPGQGEPLILDDDALVPDELRVAYRALKTAGCLPPELVLRREINEIENLLHLVESDNEQRDIRRRLGLLRARLSLQGREANLLLQDGIYRQKLIRRMARDRTRG